ncbi:Thiol-disulfide oxidoreductase ResA [bacterium HR33]|nr:Thiol-disulfide oxidoreductase ResA [bacterium HR33]
MVADMRRLALSLIASCSVALQGAAAQDIGLPIGSTPEAVEIEDLDGNPVNLAQYVGRKPVLIEFWATWCPLCAALFPKLEQAHHRYGDQVEFLVIAVAVNQSKASIKRHLERHPMPFVVLWDTQGRAVRAFKAPTTSYIVALDASGKVTYTGSGEDQDIEAAVKSALK